MYFNPLSSYSVAIVNDEANMDVSVYVDGTVDVPQGFSAIRFIQL